MKHTLWLFCLFISSLAYGQERATLSGTVKDSKTGETLIGVAIQTADGKIGTPTNEYGFYSLSLPQGDYNLKVIYTGYAPKNITLKLTGNQKLDIRLDDQSQELGEVVVSATAGRANLREASTGMVKLDMQSIKDIPVLFGEKDPLKTLQLLPGVKTAGEGSSGFFVRGGAASENLVLLDEAPVYNASHLLGFFSTFNADAVKSMTLYKGNMPAQYGGRLSSVLDVKMNDGDNQKTGVSGGIGLISSKLTVEGPIVKDKGSFLITGRRTYADLFLKLSNDEGIKNNQLYFYDLNMKANYTLSDKDKLFLSGYFGRDKIAVGDLFGLGWGNATGTLRWNRLINPKLFSNTSLIFSDFDYKVNLSLGQDAFDITSRIRDWNLKQEFQYYSNPQNLIRFGFNTVLHTIIPGTVDAGDSPTIKSTEFPHRKAWENAVYVNNEWTVNSKLSVNYGLRLTSFSALGGTDYYTYDELTGETSDTLFYDKGKFVKNYFSVEPRLSMSYQVNDNTSLKASYSHNAQNLHLLSNSAAGSPTDRWIMSSNVVKPELSDQVALGYFRNFSNDRYEFSAETYYKVSKNQVDYRDGAEVNRSADVEGQLLFGKGRAYGIELLLRKQQGRLTGWIGYTLSKSEKQIEGINNGDWYRASQDRTHDISVVGIYNLTKKWTLSGTWVYYTGNAVSFPSGKYGVADNIRFYYGERNGYRMPAYHRMDLSATKKLRERPRWSSELSFSLYNAYGRKNAYSIDFEKSEDDPNITQAVQTTLFQWVPSISYNFKFK